MPYDRDGQGLAAVRHLVKAAGYRDTGVMFAACDALYAIIRYSAGPAGVDGTAMLLDFLQSPYERPIQDYARQKLTNILE